MDGQRAIEVEPQGESKSALGASTGWSDEIIPIVRARVVKTLRRCSTVRGDELRELTRDVVQDVLEVLFSERARVLSGWDPERGLSFLNYVGLVAERRASNASRALRLRRKWRSVSRQEDTNDRDRENKDEFESGLLVCEPEVCHCSSDLLRAVLQELQNRLSPRGRELFVRLFVLEQAPSAVAAELSLTLDAAYQWKRRLRTLALRIRQELEGD